MIVQLKNRGSSPAIEIKLTLVDSRTGERILPAYYSDNYVSLLPGESREISIGYGSVPGQGQPQLAIRGWNVPSGMLAVEQRK